MRPIRAPAADRVLDPAPAPSFAVVIAAYQAAGTIGDALSSAVQQTVPAAEIVVCDDGSTDDLAAALTPFAEDVELLRQGNRGEGAAKNAGVRAASADFAVFLDADDAFLPERLEALAELASARPDLDILTTDAFLEVDGVVSRRCYDASWEFEVDDQRRGIVERNFVFGLAAVRRARFLAAGGFDESLRFATDWDLWLRLILGGAKVGLVEEPLAVYRLRSNSLSAQRARLLRGRCAVLEKALSRDDLTERERERAREALARNHREALLAEAREALVAHESDARSRALRVAASREMPVLTRLKALTAAAAPRRASRFLVRERERSGVAGPADVRFRL
jgi:glycosyltransferase involved in cell wall biosynthesis